MPNPIGVNGMIALAETPRVQSDAEDLVLRYLAYPRPELKDQIMVQYTPLVERTARKFKGLEPIEDLVQVGYMGLLNALGKFDPDAGVRFNTYATYLVAGEIKHYLRDRAQTIRQPAWLQELRSKCAKVEGSLRTELGREATHREIAERVGASESQVHDAIQAADLMRLGSLDAALPGDDDTTEIERLDAGDFCPEQLSIEDRVVLESAFSHLREMERQVLVGFHFESRPQSEIAEKLGVSTNYVSHILRQSLQKLRKILTAEEEQDRLLRRQAEELDYDTLDPVTGAYTEGFLRHRLEEEAHRASAEGGSVALVRVQFDGFDEMRRFYGEAAVRDFLQDAADFLKRNVRRLDLVARDGETGFAIMLPFTGGTVEVVRDRLVKAAAAFTPGRMGPRGSLVVRMGTASLPESGRWAKDLYAAATPV